MDYAAVKTVASIEARFTGASVVSTPCTPRGLGRAPDSRQNLPARLGTSSSPRPMPPRRASAMSKLWAVVLVLLLALSLPFGLVSPAQGAVTFDAATASSNADASSSTISYTHTPVGTPTAVVVTVISTGA